MENVKEYLMLLGRHIDKMIQENDDPSDIEAVDEIAEYSEDYNHIYKFYCHHEHVKRGMDPREHQEMTGHHASAPTR